MTLTEARKVCPHAGRMLQDSMICVNVRLIFKINALYDMDEPLILKVNFQSCIHNRLFKKRSLHIFRSGFAVAHSLSRH